MFKKTKPKTTQDVFRVLACLPVLQGQPQRCGIGFVFSHQHAHPLGIAFAFLQGYGEEIILGLEVFDAATKKKTLVSRSRPVIGHVPHSTGKEARQSCEEDMAGGGSANTVLAMRA